MGTRVLSQGTATVCEVNHSPPSSVEVKDEMSYKLP